VGVFQVRGVQVVIGLAGLLVAVVAVALLTRQMVLAEAMMLSNGKTVRMGQSLDSVKKAMGDDIVERANLPGAYRYPADYSRVNEATIYFDDDKVVAVIAARNEKTRQLGSDISVGASRSQLTSSFGKKLLQINTQSDVVKHKGYKVISARNVSYYLTSTCLPNEAEKVTVLAVAKKGFSDRMAYLTRPLQCSAPAGPNS
jgi:hypothetical protein